MSEAEIAQELRELIAREGPISFDRFQQVCLYSQRGGFYSTRQGAISAHFGTSATYHPVFGALIVRQLDEMWQLLGRPARFHVIEVGSGDGFSEVLAEPTPGVAERLGELDVPLIEAARGEVNLAMAPWCERLAEALERGFVLTIDYGEQAHDLYSEEHSEGTVICFSHHA